MRVHCDEGVASRIGAESCVGAREGVGEALTGECVGQPLSRERLIFWVPTRFQARKAARRSASSQAPCRPRWTRAQIRTLIANRFSVELSLVAVGRLLAQLGLTCQRPLFSAYQQDGSLVERWLKEEYPKIRLQAKREKAEIFFEDESGVRSDFHSGTTWAPKGKTPAVRVTGQRFSLNIMSAVSPRGELHFMVVRGGVGAAVFINFRFLSRICGRVRARVERQVYDRA